ncbi:CBS domain protein [Mumia flava]|uniref:CBS domain protein n=1 Tax=Mumia flava TaxID=1348852 RepID=A0A0B2BPP5_9ACTN|nr:CBS domain-containing protein [Mumia flava]PJJ56498.1 CBS domain protein [Mumia flava]
MKVSDIVSSKGSTEVFTIRPDASVSDLLDVLAEHNIGALIVSEDGDHVLGIVSERDIVRKLRGVPEPGTQTVEAIMTTDVHSCQPGDDIGVLMSIMTDRRIRHIPVLDEEGALTALLSIGDVVKFRTEQLEFERDQLNEYVAQAR